MAGRCSGGAQPQWGTMFLDRKVCASILFDRTVPMCYKYAMHFFERRLSSGTRPHSAVCASISIDGCVGVLSVRNALFH